MEINDIHDSDFDSLVEEKLGWTKVLRHKSFPRAWINQRNPFFLNNTQAVNALQKKGIDLSRFLTECDHSFIGNDLLCRKCRLYYPETIH